MWPLNRRVLSYLGVKNYASMKDQKGIAGCLNMKICLISKYPPIEGGESSKAYWLSKGLGERGHEIFVVTNAWEVESEYRENFIEEDIDNYQPKNVTVYNTSPFLNPRYIPYANPYTEKLASLAIDVIRRHNADLIDSWYILPYCISAFITKTITNKPQILRHAGSDMSRLLDSPYLNTLFVDIFNRVDKIVTYPGTKERFLSMGVPESKIFLNKVSVDTNAFNPNSKPFDISTCRENYTEDIPIITYIGKASKQKGIFELVKALSKINENFILLLVTKGHEIQKLKYDIKRLKLENKTLFLDFIPPWKIPSIMKASTCIVSPEWNFPVISHTPILPREAMCTGKCTILSEELFNKRTYRDMEDGIHTKVVNPSNIDNFKIKLEEVIKNPNEAEEIGSNARKLAGKYENFDKYLKNIEELYKSFI